MKSLSIPFFQKPVRKGGCTAALPYNGVIHRFSCLSIPDNSGLSLIGNADGGNLVRGGTNFTERFYGNPDLAGPDFICIVFYPARIGIILPEFLLRGADNIPVTVKKNTAVACCSRIQRHHIFFFCHILPAASFADLRLNFFSRSPFWPDIPG